MTQDISSARRARAGQIIVGTLSLLVIGSVFAACGKTPEASGRPVNSYSSSVKSSVKVVNVVAPVAHVNLTIVAQKPGSSIQGPSYTPSTSLTVPAHSLVTVTIVNADEGDTPLPAGSPFSRVTGAVSGHATVDGLAYSSLAPDKVAHTFTIPGLGVNVPIPGDVPAGHTGITVTFSFETGAAGSYMWQCMDPCGSDPAGWGGPMRSMGYMMGTVTVVG